MESPWHGGVAAKRRKTRKNGMSLGDVYPKKTEAAGTLEQIEADVAKLADLRRLQRPPHNHC